MDWNIWFDHDEWTTRKPINYWKLSIIISMQPFIEFPVLIKTLNDQTIKKIICFVDQKYTLIKFN